MSCQKTHIVVQNLTDSVKIFRHKYLLQSFTVIINWVLNKRLALLTLTQLAFGCLLSKGYGWSKRQPQPGIMRGLFSNLGGSEHSSWRVLTPKSLNVCKGKWQRVQRQC